MKNWWDKNEQKVTIIMAIIVGVLILVAVYGYHFWGWE